MITIRFKVFGNIFEDVKIPFKQKQNKVLSLSCALRDYLDIPTRHGVICGTERNTTPNLGNLKDVSTWSTRYDCEGLGNIFRVDNLLQTSQGKCLCYLLML